MRPTFARTAFAIAVLWLAPPAVATELELGDCSVAAAEGGHAGLGDACATIIENTEETAERRAQALLRRGIWHWRGQRDPQAKDDLERGLQLAPDHAKLLQLLAMLHLDRDELDIAKRLAERSAAIDPTRGITFEILGRLEQRQGQFGKALAHYDKSVQLNADRAFVRYMRAKVLVRLARAPDALTDTAWLIAQPPEKNDQAGVAWIDGHTVKLHLAGLIAHAEVLVAMDRLAEAEVHYDRILSHQRNAFTLTQRSQFLHALPSSIGSKSRLPEALADAEEAVRLDPKDARAYRQYASTLEYSRRHRDALAAVERALELESYELGLPALLWMRARLLRALSRQEEAIESAQLSLVIAQDVAPDYFQQRIQRLSELGYWQDPGDSQSAHMVALSDAVAACMADEACW
jgi:tetratricopeptide (TPR) repeat protein